MNLRILSEVYQALRLAGLVTSEREFCQKWLARSECYLRTLRCNQSNASAEVLAILGSRLGEQANALARPETQQLHQLLTALRHQVYEQLELRVRARWKRAFAAAKTEREDTGTEYLSKHEAVCDHAHR
jgi:hypothetical protein